MKQKQDILFLLYLMEQSQSFCKQLVFCFITYYNLFILFYHILVAASWIQFLAGFAVFIFLFLFHKFLVVFANMFIFLVIVIVIFIF